MNKKDVKLDSDLIDPKIKEVYTNSSKSEMFEKLTKEQVENLKKQIEKEFNLDSTIKNINIEFPKKRVIYVDGDKQLIYDDGEFLFEDTIDSKKTKNKISKKKAVESYIEFFVRYTLNPLIEESKIENMTKQIIKVNDKKEKGIRNKEEKLKELKSKQDKQDMER